MLASVVTPPANALGNERDSTVWGHIFAGQSSVKTFNATTTSGVHLESKSKFEVTYINFPAWAQSDIQAALDVWSANFQSSVPIKVEATWGRSQVYGLLGSARPGNYFNNFINAPDPTLWYPSALANALAFIAIGNNALIRRTAWLSKIFCGIKVPENLIANAITDVPIVANQNLFTNKPRERNR